MSETESNRLPPQNLEAEMSVLGGVLLENDALNRALELLIPDDFYRDSHRQIFKALIALSDRNEPADLVTLTAELKKSNQMENVGAVLTWPRWLTMFPPQRIWRITPRW